MYDDFVVNDMWQMLQLNVVCTNGVGFTSISSSVTIAVLFGPRFCTLFPLFNDAEPIAFLLRIGAAGFRL